MAEDQPPKTREYFEPGELEGIVNKVLNEAGGARDEKGVLTDEAVGITSSRLPKVSATPEAPRPRRLDYFTDPTSDRRPDGPLTAEAEEAARQQIAGINLQGGTAPNPSEAGLPAGPGDVDVAQAAGAARRTLDAAYGAGGPPQPPAPTAR